MNALVKKEIGLLLPGAGGVLLLETLLPWVYQDANYVVSFARPGCWRRISAS